MDTLGLLSHERLLAFEAAASEVYSWETVLEDGGIHDFKATADGFNCKCPFHPDKRPSFFVHKNTSSFFCYSCREYGSVVKLMYKMKQTDIPATAFYDQLLKANKYLQDRLGFSTLFVDSKSLSPEFNKRRTFSAAQHLNQCMPMSVFTDKAIKADSSWENLVYTLSLLQANVSPDDIWRLLSTGSKQKDVDVEEASKTSLKALLLED